MQGHSRTHEPEFPDRPLPVWQELVTDSWMINIVREGLRLQFVDPPPLRSHPIPYRIKDSRLQKLEAILEDLLAKSALELVPAPREDGFYSRLFLVPKKGGGMATSHRSECIQQFSSHSTLQNGNFSISNTNSSAQRVGLQYRFTECIIFEQDHSA